MNEPNEELEALYQRIREAAHGPPVFHPLDAQQLANLVNRTFNVRNPDGTPGKMTAELMEKLLPYAVEYLPRMPPDGLVAGKDS
jgi:hypothetical protein